MRQHVHACQPQPGQIPPVRGVDRLAGLLRLRVHRLRAVHRAGADADHDAAEALDRFPQLDLTEPPVLRGHMPAAEPDYVVSIQINMRFARVPQVERTETESREAQRFAEERGHAVVALVRLRHRRDHQAAGTVRPHRAQPIREAVHPVQTFHPAAAVQRAGRAARQKQRFHISHAPFGLYHTSFSAVLQYPPECDILSGNKAFERVIR